MDSTPTPTPTSTPTSIPTTTPTSTPTSTPTTTPTSTPTSTPTTTPTSTPTSVPVTTSSIQPSFYTNSSEHFYSFYSGNYMQNRTMTGPTKIDTFPQLDLPSLFNGKKYIAIGGIYLYAFDSYGIPNYPEPLKYDKSLCTGNTCRICNYSSNKIECGCADPLSTDETLRNVTSCTSTGTSSRVWAVYVNPLYNQPSNAINVSILPFLSSTRQTVFLPYTSNGFDIVVLTTSSLINPQSLEITYTKQGDYSPSFKIGSDPNSLTTIGYGTESIPGKAVIPFTVRNSLNNWYITVDGLGSLDNKITYTSFKFL